MYVCTQCAGSAPGAQKGVSGPLNLELQMITTMLVYGNQTQILLITEPALQTVACFCLFVLRQNSGYS